MPHGFDFATQNLSGSVRSIPAPSYLTEGGLVKIRKLLDGANVPVDLDLSQATGLTYIATDTFIECFTMQSVKLPSSVTEIGKYAFEGCTSLTQAPELPAKKLADSCYASMFSGCTSLTQAPELPADTLAASCYNFMFSGCTGLTQAPKLPAKKLADSCYADMFSGCTSLTQAPELPAETLARRCYYGMFSGCEKLNSVTMLATNVNAFGALHQWLDGTAADGTLYVANEEMTTDPTITGSLPTDKNWKVAVAATN